MPRSRVDIHRSIRQSSPPDPSRPEEVDDWVRIETVRLLDVDGDGELDALVPEPEPSDCLETIHFAVFLVHHGCAERVPGVLAGALWNARTVPASSRLSDVVTVSATGVQPDPRVPAELQSEERRYRFDGQAYRLVDDRVAAVTCHHCAQETCTVVEDRSNLGRGE